MNWDENAFYGLLVQGRLTDAMDYLKSFPEQQTLYERYLRRFELTENLQLDADELLNQLFSCYQNYYREVFYRHGNTQQAEKHLRDRLAAFLSLPADIALEELEQTHVSEAFARRGFHFIGGRTGGYWGPYIWKRTEETSFSVQLPDGIQNYPVRFMFGFLSKSWLDYLSFGAVSPGGWSNGDGIIHCIHDCYDVQSESFQVSLLKHEAQHAMDLHQDAHMPSEKLEYRAKLVELIYSEKRNLLAHFLCEAGEGDAHNGHSLSAAHIIRGFCEKLATKPDSLSSLPIPQIQRVAAALFAESNQNQDVSSRQKACP